MINPRTHGSVDVVDLRSSQPFRKYRIVQAGSMANAACTGAATGQCISNGRPGTWSPHDAHFSRNGRTMYVAAVGNDTVLVDVRNVLSGTVSTIGVAPNDSPPANDVASNPHDVSISHQSDVTADGQILVVTDERGGGTSETRCNTEPNGVIGGMHFWALERISGVAAITGASPASPKRIGGWFYPNPTVLPDVLATRLSHDRPRRAGVHDPRLPARRQRNCVARVDPAGVRRRLVAAASPGGLGPLQRGRLAHRPLPRTERHGRRRRVPVHDLGNTLGWNVMPGAETWSAKEYKGFVYAGDMTRGFDVYGFAECEGAGCVDIPTLPWAGPSDEDSGGDEDD